MAKHVLDSTLVSIQVLVTVLVIILVFVVVLILDDKERNTVTLIFEYRRG